MEERVIAQKNSFSLITKISTIVLLIIFILLPSSNKIFLYLNYLAYVIIIVVFILTLLQLLQPKDLITKKDDKLYINKINKVISLDLEAIADIEVKHKKSRGYRYHFGTLTIYTKTKQIIRVYNVNKVDEVWREIKLLKNK